MNPIIEGVSYKGKAHTYDLREPFPSFCERCAMDVFVLCFTLVMFIASFVCIILDGISMDIAEVVVFIFCIFLFYSLNAFIEIYVFLKDKEIYYMELVEWRVYQEKHIENNES